jgi:hypothetical protein
MNSGQDPTKPSTRRRWNREIHKCWFLKAKTVTLILRGSWKKPEGREDVSYQPNDTISLEFTIYLPSRQLGPKGAPVGSAFNLIFNLLFSNTNFFYIEPNPTPAQLISTCLNTFSFLWPLKLNGFLGADMTNMQASREFGQAWPHRVLSGPLLPPAGLGFQCTRWERQKVGVMEKDRWSNGGKNSEGGKDKKARTEFPSRNFLGRRNSIL